MKVSDFIVGYLIDKGITDVFGYPGGMIAHLVDSLSKKKDKIHTHIPYHEQGAAFAACGYAQASGKIGVAYSSSGPGATNLITGICNAYFDSIPTLFITGQVNTFESKEHMGIRQRGFQEADIVSMVLPVTKYAVRVNNVTKIKWYLDYAFWIAFDGRKGPVLLDIPMDIQRADIDPSSLVGYSNDAASHICKGIDGAELISEAIHEAKRPVFLFGNGVKSAGAIETARIIARNFQIPTVSTMLAVDIINDQKLNYGFIGAYGNRAANFIVAKSDLIVSFGARLDVRQVGVLRKNFAPNARLIRIDVDNEELKYKVHENEEDLNCDIQLVMTELEHVNASCDFSNWIDVCNTIRDRLEGKDDLLPNRMIKAISRIIPDDVCITTDVGQNQIWVAQSLQIKQDQKLFFSGGLGAMGYSLPAAIGITVATKKPVYSFSGDGGLQMNIQELQTIARENLPITVILFNNTSLGMIRHFQEMYFDGNYYQTVPEGGYTVPDFAAIANAYGFDYLLVKDEDDFDKFPAWEGWPRMIEVQISEKTYVYPKLEFGKPNHDQEPLLDRELFELLERL